MKILIKARNLLPCATRWESQCFSENHFKSSNLIHFTAFIRSIEPLLFFLGCAVIGISKQLLILISLSGWPHVAIWDPLRHLIKSISTQQIDLLWTDWYSRRRDVALTALTSQLQHLNWDFTVWSVLIIWRVSFFFCCWDFYFHLSTPVSIMFSIGQVTQKT